MGRYKLRCNNCVIIILGHLYFHVQNQIIHFKTSKFSACGGLISFVRWYYTVQKPQKKTHAAGRFLYKIVLQCTSLPKFSTCGGGITSLIVIREISPPQAENFEVCTLYNWILYMGIGRRRREKIGFQKQLHRNLHLPGISHNYFC